MTAKVAERLLTIAEWEQFESESDRRFELVKGRLVEMTEATNEHGNAMNKLWLLLYTVLSRDLWKILTSNSGVAVCRGSRQTGRIPDVLVLRKDTFHGKVRTNEPSDVLLAVEVVSDSTEREDRIEKRGEYEQAGVPNYWIVDVREESRGPKLTALTLVDEKYQERACGPDEQGQVLIPDLAGVEVAFHWDDLVS